MSGPGPVRTDALASATGVRRPRAVEGGPDVRRPGARSHWGVIRAQAHNRTQPERLEEGTMTTERASRVVVGFDGSDEATDAVRWGAAYAAQHGTDMLITAVAISGGWSEGARRGREDLSPTPGGGRVPRSRSAGPRSTSRPGWRGAAPTRSCWTPPAATTCWSSATAGWASSRGCSWAASRA